MVTFEEISFIIQNLSNPVVDFTLIVFATGYLACKMEFGAGKNWRGIDRYLAAFGIGFGIQSISLLSSGLAAALLIMWGFGFEAIFFPMLIMTSIMTLFLLLNSKMEIGTSFLANYKRLCRVFWNLASVAISFVYLPLMITFFYPTYLSRVSSTSWQAVYALIVYLVWILAPIFFLLNRWFILRNPQQKPLQPFGLVKQLRTSARLLQQVRRIRRNYLPALIFIATLVVSVAFDAAYPLFTPKIVQSEYQDRYYYHSPYQTPYDYILALSPGPDGMLVGHVYSLYNATVEVLSARFPVETCVIYDNPAGSSYLSSLSSPSSIGFGIYMPQNYLDDVYTNSTNVSPIGNQTNTKEIQQCTAGRVNFYFWKEVSIPSIQTNDKCTIHGYVRTDNLFIENKDNSRIYVGLIALNYIYRSGYPQVSYIVNGLNVTGAASVQAFGQNVWISPYMISGNAAANPFNVTRYSINLAYNSTYSPGCQ